jgi:hypothetical protein
MCCKRMARRTEQSRVPLRFGQILMQWLQRLLQGNYWLQDGRPDSIRKVSLSSLTGLRDKRRGTAPTWCTKKGTLMSYPALDTD